MEKFVAEDKVRFVCPFCSKGASAGEGSDGPYVLHEQPACEKFLALEPHDYMKEVREYYQRGEN